MLSQATVIAGTGSRGEPENLPWSMPSSPRCYVDVIAICILKGFYIKCLVGLKIKSTSSRMIVSAFVSGGLRHLCPSPVLGTW